MTATVLPKAIQAQLDEAERLMQETPPEPAPAEAVVHTEPPEPPPQPEPQPQAPVATVVSPEPQEGAEYWRQRFQTIEGKYRAEVPRLTETVHTLQGQLQQLLQQRQQTPPPPEPQVAPLITPKDEEAFGADLIDAMRRAARDESKAVTRRLETVENYLRQLTPKVERVAQVEQSVQENRQVTFYSELAKAVPDWEAINADPRWLAWLAEYDPVAGKPRQQSLDEAAAGFDHPRTVALFNLFKGAAQPAAPRTQVNPELARQVAPSKSSTATPAPTAARQYTSKDYTYWTDPRRVHDTARDKLDTMISELERAVMEGRVQW